MAKFKVRVTPRAKQNRILGWQGDVLRVHIAAPPVGGMANQALIKFLSGEWGVAKSNIKIVRGERAREKLLEAPDGVIQRTLQNTLI